MKDSLTGADEVSPDRALQGSAPLACVTLAKSNIAGIRERRAFQLVYLLIFPSAKRLRRSCDRGGMDSGYGAAAVPADGGRCLLRVSSWRMCSLEFRQERRPGCRFEAQHKAICRLAVANPDATAHEAGGLEAVPVAHAI
jgi:hypothetical protein